MKTLCEAKFEILDLSIFSVYGHGAGVLSTACTTEAVTQSKSMEVKTVLRF